VLACGRGSGDARESTGPSLEARINASTIRRLTAAGVIAAVVSTTAAATDQTRQHAEPDPAVAAAVDVRADRFERASSRAHRLVRAAAAPRVLAPPAPPRAAEGRAVAPARKKRVRAVVRTEPRRTIERARTTRTAAHRAVRKPARVVQRRAVRVVGARAGVSSVVGFAYRQLGRPYRMGAAGPRAFDCSGLTMRAYARAGLRLPHKAARQLGRPVSLSAARPGDLVKWGGYHVGIYVGGGQVIHAPKPGDRVKKSRLWGSYRIVRIL
jgi:cell wall-associated NlpC family hydrolase